jgi:electron transfer flavoprotein beta subunit
MKILVPVKRVVDCNVKVQVKSDGTSVDIVNVKMSMKSG